MKALNKKTLLVPLIFLIIAIFTFYFMSKSTSEKRTAITLILDKCNPQYKTCYVKHEGISFGISLDENILYLTPFNVTVFSNDKVDVKKIHINFKMKDMNMGFNNFGMKNNGERQWLGMVVLPICVTGRADWIATIEIKATKNNFIVAFPVSIYK